MAASMAVHCEAAGLLGSRLGLDRAVTKALQHGFERWDGDGHPGGLAEDMPLPVRIVVLARDVVLWHAWAGRRGAGDGGTRRGRAYDPEGVDAYLGLEDRAPTGGRGSVWEEHPAAEPLPVVAPTDVDGLLTCSPTSPT